MASLPFPLPPGTPDQPARNATVDLDRFVTGLRANFVAGVARGLARAAVDIYPTAAYLVIDLATGEATAVDAQDVPR